MQISDLYLLNLPQASVYYLPNWLNASRASDLEQRLRDELDWHQGDVKVFGRWHKTPRLQAWHGDPDVQYRYSGKTLNAMPWTPALDNLRFELQKMDIATNAVLANLYRDGNDKMGWHSDNEPELGEQPVIASVSLGAERDFLLRHRKLQHKCSLTLKHGSLLVMSGDTQHYWQHSLPVRKKVSESRINLTFRRLRD
ncbi:alpha-ketoglutarate-dependent dioxygenase AlkB [Aliidiomarina minuta]|uniref:Alpha-ketoglutarate-dependent dioxygenase AlkB n=1 Tax=Aliidiomarina minuta TaxID=880057 RepID=A0A432WAB9_9GAMM|nr:alpha-ketoglutarate-dependent dioxygenase AlkB [Aliidiomarina minuta]RUO27059.1 alpha-ketoglutarate-dependent dioxygenase AlkB [Aliidiomarina minuta]